MLSLDIGGVMATAITPAMGIADKELLALHTPVRRHVEAWLRERRDGEHGWAMAPYSRKVVDAMRETAQRLRREKVTTVLWLGIGGSGLGPRVLQEAFEHPGAVEFHVVDTIDPAVLQMYLDVMDWTQTAVVVVSKSGSTLETMSAFFLFWEQLQTRLKAKAKQRVVGITDPKKGPLRTFCLEQGIECHAIAPDIGGRYSIFSPVGLLALALLGRDIAAFLRGAKAMDELCQSTVLDENPAALLAGVQYLLDTKKGHPIRVIMPYSQRMRSVAGWNQQLVAESLGKNEVSNPFPVAAIGTQDQHSLLQQWLAGPRKAWHIFLRERTMPTLAVPAVKNPDFASLSGKQFSRLLDACADGTAQALTKAKRPHVTITIDTLDEEHLGQIFFLFMAEVVLLGKLYRIDPYGQPAVETGKIITRRLLEAA